MPQASSSPDSAVRFAGLAGCPAAAFGDRGGENNVFEEAAYSCIIDNKTTGVEILAAARNASHSVNVRSHPHPYSARPHGGRGRTRPYRRHNICGYHRFYRPSSPSAMAPAMPSRRHRRLAAPTAELLEEEHLAVTDVRSRLRAGWRGAHHLAAALQTHRDRTTTSRAAKLSPTTSANLPIRKIRHTT
jgi:hypothetical protein